MSEALHSFIVSVSCIIGAAVLIPSIELIAKRMRRIPAAPEQPEVVRLTPVRPSRRNF